MTETCRANTSLVCRFEQRNRRAVQPTVQKQFSIYSSILMGDFGSGGANHRMNVHVMFNETRSHATKHRENESGLPFSSGGGALASASIARQHPEPS